LGVNIFGLKKFGRKYFWLKKICRKQIAPNFPANIHKNLYAPKNGPNESFRAILSIR